MSKTQKASAQNDSEDSQDSAPPGQRAAIAKKLRDAKPGDILLFNHAKKWNRLITWLTRSRYYHVGIYQGDFHVVEARPRGVVSRDLNGPDGDRYFDVAPAPDGKGRAALDWAEQQIGSGYDKTDALAITLDQLFNMRCACLGRFSKGEFSCGEFVALSFKHAGIELFPQREARHVVPAHFEPLLPRKK